MSKLGLYCHTHTSLQQPHFHVFTHVVAWPMPRCDCLVEKQPCSCEEFDLRLTLNRSLATGIKVSNNAVTRKQSLKSKI